jgi:hypothetical protein
LQYIIVSPFGRFLLRLLFCRTQHRSTSVPSLNYCSSFAISGFLVKFLNTGPSRDPTKHPSLLLPRTLRPKIGFIHRSLAASGHYIRDVKGKRSRTKNIWTQKIPEGLGPSDGHTAGWALAGSNQHIHSFPLEQPSSTRDLSCIPLVDLCCDLASRRNASEKRQLNYCMSPPFPFLH